MVWVDKGAVATLTDAATAALVEGATATRQRVEERATAAANAAVAVSEAGEMQRVAGALSADTAARSAVDTRIRSVAASEIAGAIADSATLEDAAAAALQNEAVLQRVGPYRGDIPDGALLASYGHSAAHTGTYRIVSANVHEDAPSVFNGLSRILRVETTGTAGWQEMTSVSSSRVYVRHMTSTVGVPRQWSDWRRTDVTTGQITDLEAAIPSAISSWRGVMPSGDIDQYGNATDSGVWGFGTSQEYTNSPIQAGQQGVMTVQSNSYGAWQLVQRYSESSRFLRYCVTVSPTRVWSPWKRVDITHDDLAALDSRLSAVEATSGGSDVGRLIAPLESTLDTVALWGDSNLHNGGTAARLNTLLPGSTVRNFGASGQTARMIASRQGGAPSFLTVTGNTIPSSGDVEVTDLTVQVLRESGLPARSITGTLAGVHGTLTVEAGTYTDYTFTRTAPGEPAACPPGTPFISDIGAGNRDSVSVFWVGGNMPTDGVHVFNVAMASHLSPAHKRFIVLSCLTRSDEPQGTQGYADNLVEIEKGRAAFGPRFLDIRAYLVEHGLDDLGITPTSEDLTAMAGDTVPPSLTTDGAHLTTAAQALVGDQIHSKFVELGWTS